MIVTCLLGRKAGFFSAAAGATPMEKNVAVSAAIQEKVFFTLFPP
jgi:hypothetical protein